MLQRITIIGWCVALGVFLAISGLEQWRTFCSRSTYMMYTKHTHMYTRDWLLSQRHSGKTTPGISVLTDLEIYKRIKTRRSRRAGTKLIRKIPVLIPDHKGESDHSNSWKSIHNCVHRNVIQIPLTNPNQTKRGLLKVNCGLINVRSLNNKTDRLSNIISEKDLDIVFLTETWLTSVNNTIAAEATPTGFTLKHLPRGSRGGGVGVLFKSSLKIKVSTMKPSAVFEGMAISVAREGRTYKVLLLYRPKKSTSLQFVSDFSQVMDDLNLTNDGSDLIILGDLNFHYNKPDDMDTWRLTDFLSSYNLVQHVHEPTHTSGNTLDLVITRAGQDTVNDLSVFQPMLADHFFVQFTMLISKPPLPRKQIEYRSLKNIDLSNMQRDLATSIEVKPGKDLVEAVAAYERNVSAVLENHAPLQIKTVILRPKVPWLDESTLHERRKERQLERQYRKSKLTVHRVMWKEQARSVDRMIESAKVKHFSDRIEAASPADAIGLINGLMARNSQSPLPSHESEEELASRFNCFFMDKVTKIRNNFPSCDKDTDTCTQEVCGVSSPLTSFNAVTPEQLSKIIMSMKTKQCSLDPLPTGLTKECLNSLIPAVTNIINVSLSTATFPSQWKRAIVRPLLKKASFDPEVLKNYRPVSNLAFLSKVLEKVVASQLTAHIEGNHLQTPFQSAYRASHSVETALLKVHNDIVQALAERKGVLLVLLDLSAAFDTVDHDIMTERLVASGVNGLALKWIQSYLSGRTQCVKIGKVCSTPINVNCGVPQGSVLGPLLFTLYTNPLGDILGPHCRFHFYADDTQCYLVFDMCQIGPATLSMSECISSVSKWLLKNKLLCNNDKTEFIVIRSPYTRDVPSIAGIKVVDCVVDPADSARNLGVIFDKHLSFKQHISNIVRSANLGIHNISRIRKYLSMPTARRYTQLLITSRLDFCNSLLIGLPAASISKLQRVQNSAARLVTRSRRSEHITPVLRDLHWLPVPQRIEYKVLMITFKAIHGLAPVYLRDLISVRSQSRVLRSSSHIRLTQPKPLGSGYGERAFASAAPRLWNTLPPTLTSCTDVKEFKALLKTFLFRRAFIRS